MKPSLKNIAKTLSLSTAAVSKALNDYPDISNYTKNIVKNYAKKIGYQPNAQATFLRTQKTRMVGVIIPNPSEPFFAEILEGILNEAQKNNYIVVVGNSKDSFVIEKRLVNQFLQQKVDGILLSLARDTSEYKHLNDIISNKCALVMFDNVAKLIKCSKVYVDDKIAAFRATEHLIKIGCNKIAHFRGGLNPQNSIDRYLGFRDALTKYKIPYDPDKVLISNKGSLSEGYILAKKLHEGGIKIDGLLCFTDHLAIGAIRYYKENNINVPSSISVIGFSNTNLSELTYPPLSTVDQNAPRMGRAAMGLFISEQNKLSQNNKNELETVILKTKLLIRESSKNT